ncbi:hypothetical protein FA95DRAFT_1653164 [Auriscalpium vulgare]|uniref:Uncharacterized protein n=1 Tax=Auriscalpium vulgare TaxID=40419 RepID=A0ACB8RZK4_9AGAM|nr:hypothetical protein FA95DRAFT_1653164 [Auriscalpium vulgare]
MNDEHDPDTHRMRITAGGKIQVWVDFALQFFEANEKKALVLHTLPFKPKNEGTHTEETMEVVGSVDEPADQSCKRGMAVSTTTIPRLISVVEIIKREYLKTLDAKKSKELLGLYQYNELGCLEDHAEAGETADDGARPLEELLNGKHVTVKKSPYMKVTLCRQELPGLDASGATPQRPLKRKMSKSAKGRVKKHLKREVANNATDALVENEAEPPEAMAH